MPRTYPAAGTRDARHGAVTYDRAACDISARADHGGSMHRASAPHYDLDDRTILLELMLE
jgi:hypothetical protein